MMVPETFLHTQWGKNIFQRQTQYESFHTVRLYYTVWSFPTISPEKTKGHRKDIVSKLWALPLPTTIKTKQKLNSGHSNSVIKYFTLKYTSYIKKLVTLV